MPTRRVKMVVCEEVQHEFVTDVEIEDEFVEACESGNSDLISYLNEDWSLWNDALRWETCTIVENDIESAVIVSSDTPLTYGDDAS